MASNVGLDPELADDLSRGRLHQLARSFVNEIDVSLGRLRFLNLLLNDPLLLLHLLLLLVAHPLVVDALSQIVYLIVVNSFLVQTLYDLVQLRLLRHNFVLFVKMVNERPIQILVLVLTLFLDVGYGAMLFGRLDMLRDLFVPESIEPGLSPKLGLRRLLIFRELLHSC